MQGFSLKIFSEEVFSVLDKKSVQMSCVVRKLSFCICENKDADQLRGNREADQRLCFRYTDSTIPVLPTSEISSLYPSFVAVQTGNPEDRFSHNEAHKSFDQ